ncbi:SAM hydrolase/SAM-dependent halogenase family protein [Yinghuangia seranimata]|uniref:SAM hydrolase/SAM-dependent halogenase family protein n=1 Tax=Yinghuangia seranimata TaxID=408067 RepID=UPI00248C1834|nr:SAM-dependent chlorinase/fluorinase [Yinghuangia seranimata]MDI2131195.1 SAM-dependent chlorinase/fluorinase [Yinghuangia seranimata]
MPRISFLTDYGLTDGFVAACHGVIARIAPAVPVLDITHAVPPGDIRRGAVVLAQTLPYLPPGVHVAVVDPGVGTLRRGVLVRTAEHLMVGPDNGLLMWAADALGGAVAAYELTERALMLPRVSATFHGRDVFAPVAAHLALGTPPHSVGPPVPVDELVRLPEPVAYVADRRAHGEVLAVDRFGNVQTSLDAARLDEIGAAPGTELAVRTPHEDRRVDYVGTFGHVPRGTPAVLVDSSDRVALVCNGADAAAHFDLVPGDLLVIGVAADDERVEADAETPDTTEPEG